MAKAKPEKTNITIRPPNYQSINLTIEGRSPLILHKFSEKSRRQIEEKQTSATKTKATRAPKDYFAEFNAARYTSSAGWDGVRPPPFARR